MLHNLPEKYSTHLASKRLSDEAQYRSREVARSCITLAQEGIERQRILFSDQRDTKLGETR